MSLSDDVRRVLAFDGVPFGIESEAEWERARTRAVDEALCKLVSTLDKFPLEQLRKHGLAAEVRSLGIDIMSHNPKPQKGDWMQIDTQRLKDFCSMGEYAAEICNGLEQALAELRKAVQSVQDAK